MNSRATTRTRRSPDNGTAWFYLGYTLHLSGELDQALEAHWKATRFRKYRAAALYNVACVHSLRREVDLGFSALETALRSGFRDFKLLVSDPDLVPLREDRRFRRFLSRWKPKRSRPDF